MKRIAQIEPMNQANPCYPYQPWLVNGGTSHARGNHR